MDYSKFSTADLAKIVTGQDPDYSQMSEDLRQEIAAPKVEPTEVAAEPAAKRSTLYDDLLPNHSKLKSAVLGSQTGLLLGQSDEAGGLVQAGLDKGQRILNKIGLMDESPTQVSERLAKAGFTGDVGPTSSGELYFEGRDENRMAHKEAQEANPWSYGGGEVLGSILAAKGAGMVANKAGTSIPVLVQAPKAATGISGVLGRIGANAVNLAPMGAAYGLGASEAEITSGKSQDIKDAIKDVGVGAATSSIAGAGFSALGEAAGGLKSAFGKTRTASRLGQGFDEGTNLRNPTDVEAQVGTLTKQGGLKDTIAARDSEAAEDVVRTYLDMDTVLGQNVGKAAETGTKKGVPVKAGDILEGSLQDFERMASKDPVLAESPAFRKIKDNVDLFIKQEVDPVTGEIFVSTGDLTPIQAHNLKIQMGELGSQMEQTSPQISREAYKISEQLRKRLGEALPEYNTAANRMHEFRELVPEAVLNKGKAADLSGLTVSGTKNYERNLLDNLRMVIKGADDQNNPNSPAKETLNKMLQGLQQFKELEAQRVAKGQINKSIFNKFGVPPEKIEGNIKAAARQSANSAELAGETRVAPGGGSLGKVVEYSKAAIDKLAVLSGKGRTVIRGKAPNPVVKTSKLLYSATDPELAQFADRLQQVPGQQAMAKSLRKAVAEKNTSSKNALLFAILQNPSLRALVDPVFRDSIGMQNEER